MGVTDLKSETLTNADIAHRTELLRLAGWRNRSSLLPDPVPSANCSYLIAVWS